jgi:hypothetical protein
MNMPLKTLLCAITLLLAAAPTFAQSRAKIPPPEFVRETVADEAGRLQWAELKIKCEPCQGRGKAVCQGCDKIDYPGCQECKGEKRTRCRQCLGQKFYLDPIVEMNCRYCSASGWYNCGQCGGFGSFNVNRTDGSSTPQKCGACKKKGRYKCIPCDGDGKLLVVRIKKKAPDIAKLKDLLAMKEIVDDVLQKFQDFEPHEKANKSLDMIEDIIKKPAKKLPELADMHELLETALKGLTKAGSGYANYEEKKTNQFLLMKDRTVYMLQHNARVLDQCTARAEHNAGVEGK